MMIFIDIYLRSLPREKRVPTWEEFSGRITIHHLMRMFRISKESFYRLCTMIVDCVGKERFHPESANNTSNNKKIVTFPAEVKVATGIRILSGGSYLDIVPSFQVLTAWFLCKF